MRTNETNAATEIYWERGDVMFFFGTNASWRMNIPSNTTVPPWPAVRATWIGLPLIAILLLILLHRRLSRRLTNPESSPDREK